MWWPVALSEVVLREWLRAWQFTILEGQFAALVVLSVAVAWRYSTRHLDLRLVVPLLVAAGVVAEVTLLVPQTNRIYFDEQIYQGIGQNLADQHAAEMCNDGDVINGTLRCRLGEYNKEPYAYPYLLSVGYRVFGTSESLAHVFNAALCGALSLLAYLLARAIGGSYSAGIWAGAFVGTLPEQLRWANTAASEPSAAFFAALGILAALVFVRDPTMLTLAWMVSTCAFGAQFRPESIMVPVIGGLIVFVYVREKYPTRWLGLALLAVAVLLAPMAMHLLAVRHEGWGAAGPRFSLAYLRDNVPVNVRFYLADRRFPVALTVFAAVGVFQRRIPRAWVFALWGATFWGVFVCFYAGSYNFGEDVRFSLTTYTPLVVLAGLGAAALAAQHARLGQAIVATLFAVNVALYVPQVRTPTEGASLSRADVDYARRFAAGLPRDAMVYTHNPSMFHVWGVSAAQLSIAGQEPQRVRDAMRAHAGGVYLHWNFWCFVADPIQAAICNSAMRASPAVLVSESKTAQHQFAFYRVTSNEKDRLQMKREVAPPSAP